MNANNEFETHYGAAKEETRLDTAKGILEYTRSWEIITRHLPPPPASVADIGGGPGRYTFRLADLGYWVEHRDVVTSHVERVIQEGNSRVHSTVADARALDLPADSVDAVLLMGPIYHLNSKPDRLLCISEAKRIVKPGGKLIIAAISRWAQRLDGLLTSKLYRKFTGAADSVTEFENTGVLRPFRPGGFTAYTHRPGDLVTELEEGGVLLESLIGVEGLPLSEDDLAERLADPVEKMVILDSARAVETIPELLGLSSHILAVATKPHDNGQLRSARESA